MCTNKSGFGIQDSGFRIRDSGFGGEDCRARRPLLSPQSPVLSPRSSVPSPQSPVLTLQSGTSLIELIMFIVIVSVALAGLVLVLNAAGKGSTEPLIRKQALAVAESLLEEIGLQNFPGGYAGPYDQENRWQFDVMDYDGFATAGVYPMSGTTQVPGLENYNVAVTVANAPLADIPAASAALITVKVTGPGGLTVDAIGYRAAY